MKRAFFSLYLLIVIALLAIGWGLDRLWENYQPELSPGTTLALTITGIAEQDTDALPRTRALLQTLNDSGVVRASLLPEREITGTNLLDNLQSGEPVERADGDQLLYYQKLTGHPYILVLEQALPPAPANPWLRTLLTLLFYSTIALVIFLWLWPLSRDLATLEHHAQTLGLDNRYDPVALPKHATSYQLGEAFNRMANRIRELITTQRDMTHAVSHELRTPLARMKFALEMADSSQAPEQLREQLSGLRADVAEMDQLVNQLLNYARLDQVQPTLGLTQGDLQGLAEDLSKRLSRNLPDKSLQVQCTGDSDSVCDWGLMERVLHNLMQNALRHCHSQVTVTLVSDTTHYRVLVDDDGPGISPEDRERVFESFVRLRQNSPSQSAGFGLGLSIVRRIVAWHRGQVWVDESPTGGARFVLEWPRLPK